MLSASKCREIMRTVATEQDTLIKLEEYTCEDLSATLYVIVNVFGLKDRDIKSMARKLWNTYCLGRLDQKAETMEKVIKAYGL